MACKCSTTSILPLPEMYVNKALVKKRHAFYLLHKRPSLSKTINKDETTFIHNTYANFKGLIEELLRKQDITGVRIYLAAYPSDEISGYVPEGKTNTLTLIYKPCISVGGHYTDHTGDDFYILNPLSPFTIISSAVATEWIVANYQHSKLNVLNPIVTSFGCNAPDTRSILHTRKQLTELITEMDNHSAEYISINFSSYTGNENDDPMGVKKEYLFKLFVEFNMLDKYNKIISLEDSCKVFNERSYQMAFNNGVLCPPEQCAPFPL